jgi:hypothetical protein
MTEPTQEDTRQWQLIKDANAARYNKMALELFIDEQQQLIDFVHSMTEKITEAAHHHRGIYDQRMALDLLNSMAAPITQRIEQLRGSPEYLMLSEVADAELSLPLEAIPLSVDVDGRSLHDLTTEELEERVKEARAGCAKWLAERDRLATKQRQLRAYAAELEAKREEAKSLQSMVQSKERLQKEVDMLENRCATLSKLLNLRR